MKYLLFFSITLFSLQIKAETAAYFTPSPDCENQIMRLLNTAQKSIDISVYSINNNNIVETLLEVHKKGIPIRILTDRTQAGGRGAKSIHLYENGLNIRVHSKHRIEHNKFMVADDEAVITGSYNWTNPASLKNSENCLVVWNDPKTILSYKKRFEYLWDVNTRDKSDEWFERKIYENKQKSLSFDKSSPITRK